MTDRVTMVVNPASRGGRGEDVWRGAARQMERIGTTVTVRRTAQRGDGTRLAREAILDGATTVVAVGGDGTVHEVLNGFLRDDAPLNPTTRLGVLPCGTGNDVAHGLGLDRQRALLALGTDGRIGYVDVLRVRYTTRDGHQMCRYALAHVVSGVLAEATAFELRPGIKRLGQAAYLWMGLRAVLRHRAHEVVYLIDGHPEYEGLSHGCLATNTATMGAGLRVAPEARLDDGSVQVAMVGLVGRTRLLTQLLPGLRDGSYRTHPAVRHWVARTFSLDSPQRVPLALDGEPVGSAPAEVTVVHRVLPVALPPAAAARTVDGPPIA